MLYDKTIYKMKDAKHLSWVTSVSKTTIYVCFIGYKAIIKFLLKDKNRIEFIPLFSRCVL